MNSCQECGLRGAPRFREGGEVDSGGGDSMCKSAQRPETMRLNTGFLGPESSSR